MTLRQGPDLFQEGSSSRTVLGSFGRRRNNQQGTAVWRNKMPAWSKGQALVQNVGQPSFGDAEGSIVEIQATFELSGEFKPFLTTGASTSASPSASVSSSSS